MNKLVSCKAIYASWDDGKRPYEQIEVALLKEGELGARPGEQLPIIGRLERMLASAPEHTGMALRQEAEAIHPRYTNVGVLPKFIAHAWTAPATKAGIQSLIDTLVTHLKATCPEAA